MFPKIMRTSSLVIGGSRWDELEDDSDEVESVRDEDPDDLEGEIERGSWKGEDLPRQEHGARKVRPGAHFGRKTSKPTQYHWNEDIPNEDQVGSVSLLSGQKLLQIMLLFCHGQCGQDEGRQYRRFRHVGS